jgi:hypothetical protein
MEHVFRKFSVWHLWCHCLESLGGDILKLNSLNLGTKGAQTKLSKHIDYCKSISILRSVILKNCTRLSKLLARTGQILNFLNSVSTEKTNETE